MIPAFIDETSPPGERDVFMMLERGPDNWVVLHSLDLAPWNNNLRTEIDFVVIMPDTGILCIEVKSHYRIEFRDDRWHPKTIRKSPFRQALDGSQAFYRRFRDFFPQLAHVPVVHCCIFPNARFDILPNMAVAEHELIDGNRFREYRDAEAFCRDLEDRVRRSIRENPVLRPLAAGLAPGWIDQIVDHCLPIRRRIPERREEIERRAREAEERLREQQKPVLNMVALNPRVIVNGPAGTGKTLIAMEVARRAAEEGKRVALLCFNRLVGQWLADRLDETGTKPPNLVAGTVDAVLMKLAGIKAPPGADPRFWDEELPNLLEERVTDPDFAPDARFDTLVLDEAQDFVMRPRRMEVLFQFVEGGLKDGNYVLFGDFEFQVLQGGGNSRQRLAEMTEAARPAMWQLGENCRNYRVVGEAAASLAGFGKRVYSGYLRGGGDMDCFNLAWFEDRQDEAEKIAKELSAIRRLGYREEEIVLLSFVREAQSVVPLLRERGMQLRHAGENGTGIRYATIQAFKGLEASVVLLCDLVPEAGQDYQRHLLYTGITRATELVRVFCDRGRQDMLLEWLETEHYS